MNISTAEAVKRFADVYKRQVCGIGILYNGLPENEVFLHILLILSLIHI